MNVVKAADNAISERLVTAVTPLDDRAWLEEMTSMESAIRQSLHSGGGGSSGPATTSNWRKALEAVGTPQRLIARNTEKSMERRDATDARTRAELANFERQTLPVHHGRTKTAILQLPATSSTRTAQQTQTRDRKAHARLLIRRYHRRKAGQKRCDCQSLEGRHNRKRARYTGRRSAPKRSDTIRRYSILALAP